LQIAREAICGNPSRSERYHRVFQQNMRKGRSPYHYSKHARKTAEDSRLAKYAGRWK